MFIRFCQFCTWRNHLGNDPIFSKDAVLEYIQTPEKKHDKNKKYENFAPKWGDVVKCSLCEGNHDLDDYNSFLHFDLQERSKWLFRTKLCYDFVSAISVNQNARSYKNRKVCKVCKRRHPTSLHGYKAQKSKTKQQDGNSLEESKVNLTLLVCV